MSKAPQQQTTDADIAQLIANSSGNNFQSKVVNYLRRQDWVVQISPYYVDPSTDKSREVDLIAERHFYGRSSYHSKKYCVLVRLHIECKYIAENVVFWFDNLNALSAERLALSQGGFRERNTSTQEHHYLKGRSHVAKLFASEKLGRNDENDGMFRAINQCLSGYVHNRGKNIVTTLEEYVDVTQFEYPVIICSDFKKFHRTTIARGELPAPLTENFCLEVDYAYRTPSVSSNREYFLIDFVSFDQLPEFFRSIEHEAQEAHFMIQPS